jgi:S-adenosylmethionine/arginine decarboxylase-like enzyme
MKEFIPNHTQLICKGRCFNPPKNKKVLDEWMISLVEKVRMRVLSGPTSIIVDDEPGNNGITSTVVLSTSHACIHFWDELNPPMFQFDLYSCAEFTIDEVLTHLEEFDLVELEYLRIDRNNGLELTDKGKLEIEITDQQIKYFRDFE